VQQKKSLIAKKDCYMTEIFNKNKALAIVRQEIGLTKVQFAKELMVTKEHISALEAGTRDPSDMMLELIACKFFVRKEWLQTGEGKIFREDLLQIDRDKDDRQMTFSSKALVAAAILGPVAPVLSASIAVSVGATSILKKMSDAYRAKNSNELAKKLDIDRSAITHWKSSNNIPKKYIDKTVADTGVSLTELLSNHEHKYLRTQTIISIIAEILVDYGIDERDEKKLTSRFEEILKRLEQTKEVG
jgi:transcriptional regulator with XRE-family HTH domain